MVLTGRVAVVTGGAQGIGLAIAETLARSGASVAVADINRERAEEAARAIQGLGCEMDVTQESEAQRMVEQVIGRWGKLDILVNNAGITRDALLVRMKSEDWDRVLDVNLKGPFNCTKAVLPVMMKQRRGWVVNITSVVGTMGNVGQANYVASKAALIGFTKSVAREYASRGILVNAVAPGFIETAMTQRLSEEVRAGLLRQIPVNHFGTPQDVAHAVRFLVSEESGYMTGQVLHVNGGLWM